MVTAALAVRPISSASLALAAELGSLQQTRVLIRDPRWRLRASLALVPVLVRHCIPLDRLRTDVTADVASAVCPGPLYHALLPILFAELCMPSPRSRVLAYVERALWRRDWIGAAIAATAAVRATGSADFATTIRAAVAGHGLEHVLAQLDRCGFVDRHREPYAWGELVVEVSSPGSEAALEPSLPLVVGVADAIVAGMPFGGRSSGSPGSATDGLGHARRGGNLGSRAHGRIDALSRLADRLPPRDRWIARAHVARVLLHVVGIEAALAELRASRPVSVRDAGAAMLVRAASDLPAERIASTIDAPLMRQHAELAIAERQLSDEPLRARRRLGRITHPAIQLEVWRLRTTIAMMLRPDREPAPIWPHGHIERARGLPTWARTAFVPTWARTAFAFDPAPYEPEKVARVTLGAILARSHQLTGTPKTACAAAMQLVWVGDRAGTRRAFLSLLEQVGLDPTTTLATLRLASAPRRTDAVMAELISMRAERVAALDVDLPQPLRDGLAGRGFAGTPRRTKARIEKGPRRERLRETDNADARLVDQLLASTKVGADAKLPEPLRGTEIDPELSSDDVDTDRGEALAAERLRGTGDRGTLARALYDEGVAMTADPERHRRAIINASRACVRAAIERADNADPAVLTARLRTLERLGGGLAIDALAGALAMRPGDDRFVPDVLAALCRIDREAGARAAVDRATRPLLSAVTARASNNQPRQAAVGQPRETDVTNVADVANGVIDASVVFGPSARMATERSTTEGSTTEAPATDRARAAGEAPDHCLLREAELHGGLPSGFLDAWRDTFAALARRMGVAAARSWLAGWIETRGVPSIDTLIWIARRAGEEEDVPVDARAMIAEAAGRVEVVRQVWPIAAARRVAEDGALLDALVIHERPKLEPRVASWSHVQWTKHLRRAASVKTGVVDRALVSRCARRLHKGTLAHWLLAGDLAALGVERTREVGELRVRLLDKRLDLLAYLRFADVPAWSCFRSDSRLYASTRDDVIAVWKDPLSFCFRVERLDGRPWGFAFGGFAELASGPMAIVLNGLYLYDDALEVRRSVLGAIEKMLAPLGVRAIGIGNQYGGEGPLPDPYRARVVRGTRLRALRIGEARVRVAYDDISIEVNEETDLELWWR